MGPPLPYDRPVEHDAADDGLAAREADLACRERRAAAGPADPAELAGLAKERDALADAYDDAADARDAAALVRRERAACRDVAASERDRRSREFADDADFGFPDRAMSARDVDASAGDRADALSDERHAHADRQRARAARERASADRDAAGRAAEHARAEEADLREALRSSTVIGQAQGLLMAEQGITADEALDRLVRESRATNVTVRDVARRFVAQHSTDA